MLEEDRKVYLAQYHDISKPEEGLGTNWTEERTSPFCMNTGSALVLGYCLRCGETKNLRAVMKNRYIIEGTLNDHKALVPMALTINNPNPTIGASVLPHGETAEYAECLACGARTEVAGFQSLAGGKYDWVSYLVLRNKEISWRELCKRWSRSTMAPCLETERLRYSLSKKTVVSHKWAKARLQWLEEGVLSAEWYHYALRRYGSNAIDAVDLVTYTLRRVGLYNIVEEFHKEGKPAK